MQDSRFSLMDISERAMSQLFGYRNLETYYEHSQTAGSLHGIKIPTMFMSANDDPTISQEFNPYKEFEGNDHIIGCFT